MLRVNSDNSGIILSKNALTDNEHTMLHQQLSKANNGELIKSWQQLLQMAEPELLRQFLNKMDIDQTDQIQPHLLDVANIAVVVKIFANIKYANLWVNSYIKKDDLVSSLTEFSQFMLGVEHEKDLNPSSLAHLSDMSAPDLKFFIAQFNQASNKYLQLKHVNPHIPYILHESMVNEPPGNGLDKPIVELANYSFMNHSMLNTVNTLPEYALSTVDGLTNYIATTITNIQSFKILCLIYMARLPNNSAQKLDFCVDFLIAKHTQNEISEQAGITLLKMSCIASQTLSMSELNNFLIAAVQSYQKTGGYIFSLITEGDINNHGLNSLLHILQLTQYLVTLKVQIALDAVNLTDCQHSLEQQKILYLKTHAQPRSLDEVLLDFAGQESNVMFPLTTNEISTLKQQFELVQKFEQQFSLLNHEQLIGKLAVIKENLSANINTTDNICQLIAIANFTFVQHFNIYLHNVQILTILGMLLPNINFKGRLAQVKTGEGKSSIVTLLALILACQNKFIDIITSTAYLSIRDEHKYKQFFEYFGIPTAHICNNHNNFTGQIIYGTNYDFEFAKLFDDLYLQGNLLVLSDNVLF